MVTGLCELVDVFDDTDLLHSSFDMSEDNSGPDHDLLIEIKVKLERLLRDVEGVRTTVSENQEGRIRALENFRWWILGAGATLGFIGGLIAHAVFGH